LTRYTLNFGGGRLNQYTKKGRGIMAEVIAYNNIRIDLDSDIVFMTIARYKLFMAKREEGGMDAKSLYEHLQFTARMQGTNSIKANDIYLQNGLGFGKIKLKKAKAFLHKHGMIDYKQGRNPDGTMGEGYIIVHMATGGTNIVPAVQETDLPVDRPTGDSPQMLYRVSKCLKEKDKCFAPPSLQDVESYVKEKGYTVNPRTFWEYFDTGKWIDSNGNKVKNWKQKLITWQSKETAKGRPASNPADDVAKARAMVKEALERGLVK
jgi:hypothetical protein